MAKVKVKKKKSTSADKKRYSAKGLSKAVKSITGRASSEYMKYGDIQKVSDVDTQTSISAGRANWAIGDFTANQWAQKLVTPQGGSKTAGTKFRHSGKTYKIKTTGAPPITTAELVKT